jgi:O-antigen ligase
LPNNSNIEIEIERKIKIKKRGQQEVLRGKSFPEYGYVLIALFALTIALATLFSPAQTTVVSVSLRSLFVLLVACGLSVLLPCTLETLTRLCLCLTLAGTFAGALALAGVLCLHRNIDFLAFTITRPDYMYDLPEVQSFFGNPNGHGFFLVFSIAAAVILLALWRRLKERKRPAALLFYVILAVQLAALALTFSRAAFVALAVFVLGFIWYNSRRYCYTSLVLLSAAAFVSKQAFEKSGIVEVITALANGRIQLWAEGLKIFRLYPLFGTGLGGWAALSGHYLSPHNTYLHVAVELGLVGLALYLIYIALFMKDLRKMMLGAAAGSARYIILSGLYSLCLGLLVHQFFESYLYHGLPLFLLAITPLHFLMREPGVLCRFRERIWSEQDFSRAYRRVS